MPTTVNMTPLEIATLQIRARAYMIANNLTEFTTYKCSQWISAMWTEFLLTSGRRINEIKTEKVHAEFDEWLMKKVGLDG